MSAWSVIGVAVAAIAASFLFFTFLKTWRRYHGVRVITCPDNKDTAAVEVNALRAARWGAVAGEPELRLSSCTRWPEKAGCGQECLSQIESSPESCLVRSIAASFYDGKSCVYCQREMEKVVWHERPPALRAPDGLTREWKEIAPQDLPKVFAKYEPVCWPCHVRESFRRENGGLVVERPPIAAPQQAHHTLEPTSAVY